MLATHARGQFTGVVAANLPLCREHHRLVIRLDSFPPTAPGQFIQLSCRDDVGATLLSPIATDGEELDTLWARQASPLQPELCGPLAFLRRPFSLAGRRDLPGGVELDIIHRVVGVGTDWMSRVKLGDAIHLLGPLGNVFTLPPRDGAAVLIGGGVGIPPMIYLAEALAGRKAVVFSGALTRDLLPLTITNDAPTPDPDAIDPLYNIAEFARHGIPAVITTDDGSYGFRGLVTQALERYLDRYFYTDETRAKLIMYTCGPEGMMKRIADLANSRGIECQVAVERAMACGLGTCQSCCIRVKKPDPSRPPLVGKDWCWRLACTDGPVFAAKDLLW